MDQPLKDLEAYILGVIGELQPCTSYRVMKFFLESPSVYYSGSAGAIYPAINRLEKRGLITSVPSGTKEKKSRKFSQTTKGKKQFSEWFDNPTLISDGGFDPLRGRVSLISKLSRPKRLEKIGTLFNAAKARLSGMDDIKNHYPDDHPFLLSIEIERETLRAKVELLSRWLDKKV